MPFNNHLVNFSNLQSTLQSSSTTSAPSTSFVGITFKEKLLDWAIFSFLPYVVPFAVQIVEKYGVFMWYKSSTEEKEKLAVRYGGYKFYKLSKIIEENIDFIKTSLFIIKLGFAGYYSSRELEAALNNDTALLAAIAEEEITLNNIYNYSNLIVFVLYDVIGMLIKRYYRNKVKTYELTSNNIIELNERGLRTPQAQFSSIVDCENSEPRLIMGSPEQNNIRIVSQTTYAGIKLAGYELHL